MLASSGIGVYTFNTSSNLGCMHALQFSIGPFISAWKPTLLFFGTETMLATSLNSGVLPLTERLHLQQTYIE